MSAHSGENEPPTGSGCPHGFPSIKSCIDCMYEDGVGAEQKPPVTVEFVFCARFASQCPACNLGIYEGERIAKLSNESYVHERCA